MGAPETALWALPAAPDRDRLAAAIGSLAARLGAPPFEPHATVFGGITLPRDRLGEIVARAAGATSPFTLTPARLGHSAAFFQCLFLELASPEPILGLRRRLAGDLEKGSQDAALPHLSLAYAELPAVEREALARELGEGSLLATPIRFDALALVAPRLDEALDWEDVRGWRIVGRARFGGPAALS